MPSTHTTQLGSKTKLRGILRWSHLFSSFIYLFIDLFIFAIAVSAQGLLKLVLDYDIHWFN